MMRTLESSMILIAFSIVRLLPLKGQ